MQGTTPHPRSPRSDRAPRSRRTAKGLDGAVDLEGELVVESFGAKDGSYWLREHVESLRRHDLRVLGQDAIRSDADAKAPRSTARASSSPSTRTAPCARCTSPPATYPHVMQSIVTQQTVTIAPDGASEWEATEVRECRHGQGPLRGRGRRPSAAPAHLTELRHPRRRAGSLRVGERRAAPSRDVDRARSRAPMREEPRRRREHHAAQSREPIGDRSLATKTRFALSLREVSHFDASDAYSASSKTALADARRPGQLAVGSRAEQQIADQRIAGLTLDELENTMRAYAGGGAPSPQFVSRATAFLKEHPEACGEMVGLFADPGASTRGRAQILELLAGAGTPAAQQAMRDALDSPAARSDARGWQDLVQRFSVVQRRDRRQRAVRRGEVRDRARRRRSSRGRVRPRFEREQPRQERRRPERRALGRRGPRRRPEAREERAGSQGHAGRAREHGVPRRRAHDSSEYASDDSAEVRGAAAWALHDIDDPDARAALIGMTRDAIRPWPPSRSRRWTTSR